jgi:AcrR family transcriptional regulator
MSAQSVTRKGRPQEWDRSQILLAARAVAVERGFDGLRFADVSAATGVPVSSLQYAFGSRDELVREVLRAGVHEELARLKAAVDAERDPLRRIQQFIRRGISVDDSARREGWLLWIEYWRASLRDDVLREEYAQLAAGWRALVKRAIDDGVLLGRFAPEMSTEEAAAVVVAVVDGLGLQLEVGDDRMRAARAIRTANRSVARILGVRGDD